MLTVFHALVYTYGIGKPETLTNCLGRSEDDKCVASADLDIAHVLLCSC